VVVIDVYGRVQADRQGTDVYHSDSKTWSEMHDVAHELKIALIALHHTNKRQGIEDPWDLISGSMGISGSCDSQWLLMRGRFQSTAELYVSGRSIVEDIKVKFELANFSEAYEKFKKEQDNPLPSEDDPEPTTTAEKVIDILSLEPGPLSPKLIAEKSGVKVSTMRGTLRRMKSKDLVDQTTYGLYCIPGKCAPESEVAPKNYMSDSAASVTLDVTVASPLQKRDQTVRVTELQSYTHADTQKQTDRSHLNQADSEQNGHTTDELIKLSKFYRAVDSLHADRVLACGSNHPQGYKSLPAKEHKDKVRDGLLSPDVAVKEWSLAQLECRINS